MIQATGFKFLVKIILVLIRSAGIQGFPRIIGPISFLENTQSQNQYLKYADCAAEPITYNLTECLLFFNPAFFGVTHTFYKVVLYVLMNQTLPILIKWSSLQKSMSKFTAK
jgi:hypothetical protein